MGRQKIKVAKLSFLERKKAKERAKLKAKNIALKMENICTRNTIARQAQCIALLIFERRKLIKFLAKKIVEQNEVNSKDTETKSEAKELLPISAKESSEIKEVNSKDTEKKSEACENKIEGSLGLIKNNYDSSDDENLNEENNNLPICNNNSKNFECGRYIDGEYIKYTGQTSLKSHKTSDQSIKSTLIIVE